MDTLAVITVVPPEVDSRISISETEGGRPAATRVATAGVATRAATRAATAGVATAGAVTVERMDEVPAGRFPRLKLRERGSIFFHKSR